MATPTQHDHKDPKAGTSTPPNGGTKPPAPLDAKPPVTEGAATTTAPVAVEKRASRKVFIVVGKILEFSSAVEAEKFLNTDEGAPKQFDVIKGVRVEQKQRVALR